MRVTARHHQGRIGRRMVLLGSLGSWALAAAVSGVAVGQDPVYVVEDLGTLGGARSAATAMNDMGMVVGWSEHLIKTSKEIETHAFIWQRGVMRDLGTLGGGFSEARAINNRGEVVGVSSVPGGEIHAFYWYAGVMYDLVDLAPITLRADVGGFHSQLGPAGFLEANAINDDGSIVACGTVWTDHEVHGFLLTRTAQPVTLLPGKDGLVAIGTVPAAEPSTEPRLVPRYDGCFDLGRFAGAEVCQPLGVNALGMVVGVSGTTGFMWCECQLDKLDCTGDHTQGSAISDRGYTVGWGCPEAPGAVKRACIWNAGQRMDLQIAPELTSEAMGINERFQVVGTAQLPGTGRRFAVIWDQLTEAQDLNTLAVFPVTREYEWVNLEEAKAVDERGRIIANGRIDGTGMRAFILIPGQASSYSPPQG